MYCKINTDEIQATNKNLLENSHWPRTHGKISNTIHFLGTPFSVPTTLYMYMSCKNKAMSTRIRKFFFRKYCFADTKIYASTRSVFKSFTAVHTYPIQYPEIFWFALVPSSIVRENPEMSMHIIAIWYHFFPAW